MAYPNSLYASLDNGSNDAVWGNVNKIAQSFMPMFDPEVQARAEAFRRDRELFPLKRQGLEADIKLTRERALTEGAQRGYYGAQSNLLGSKTQGQQIQNSALGQLFQGSEPRNVGLVDFVKGFEGFNPNAYADGAQTSIGWGTRANPGESSISQEEADRRLAEELQSHADRVDQAAAAARYNLTPQQRNALISFDYNTGRGVDLIGRAGGDLSFIPNKMKEYVNFQGKQLPGLVKRRQAEIDLFNQVQQAPQAIDPQRAAVLASVGGVNPEQLVTGLARAQALSGGPLTEDRGRQIALAQGLLPSQTTTITPGFQQQILSANDKAEMDKAIATEAARGKVDLAKQDIAGRYGIAGDILKGAFDQMRPSGARGTSQGQGGSLSFGSAQDLYREAADTSMANFGVPMTEDGKGFDTSKDVFGPYRERWASTYSDLRQAGADPWTAKAQANLHHFGTSEPAGMLDPGGRFFGDPKVKQFNAQPFPADRLRAFGGAQRQPLQGGQLDMANVAGLLQSLGLAEPAQQQAPSPLVAAIPQTGVPESLRRPVEQPPVARDFAAENEQRKAAEKQAVGTKYNTEILRRLQSQMQRSGVSLADLANSAFSTGQKPELALQEALTAGPVPPTGGSIADYMAYTQGADVPDLADIQMALRDANALRALGFDPNQVIPFIPPQFGGQRGVQQPAQQASDLELRLQRYQ